MANIHDTCRDQWMLKGPLQKKGYDWWWHSFTGYHEKTEEASISRSQTLSNIRSGCVMPGK